ncbi:unnamed protein product [Paramecium primaurelia]|uniref:Uncharacterized protein n=1 Tax=Paramecium primaurelia TaxID=5886 RepID=A0A8S1NGV1_PARPR|nr:unnamed protein product [Paramecium primaurelia]
MDTTQKRNLQNEYAKMKKVYGRMQCKIYTEEIYSGNLNMFDDGHNQTQEELLILENLVKSNDIKIRYILQKTKGDIQHKLTIIYSQLENFIWRICNQEFINYLNSK